MFFLLLPLALALDGCCRLVSLAGFAGEERSVGKKRRAWVFMYVGWEGKSIDGSIGFHGWRAAGYKIYAVLMLL